MRSDGTTFERTYCARYFCQEQTPATPTPAYIPGSTVETPSRTFVTRDTQHPRLQ